MRYASVFGVIVFAAAVAATASAQQGVVKPDLEPLSIGSVNPANGDVPAVVQPAAVITVPKPVGAAAGSAPVQAPADPSKPAVAAKPKRAILPVSEIPDELKSKAAIATQHVRANQPNEAIALFTELLSAKPDLFTIAVERGKVHQSLKDYTKAIADFSAAIAASGDHFEAYFRRCVSHYESGAPEPAVADCGKAIAINPEPAEYYYYRGLAHTAMRSWDKAAQDLGAATKRNNQQPEAHLQLGRVYTELDQLISALREYTIALQQRPGYPEAYQGRSVVKAALGDAAGSNEDLAKIAR